MAVACTCLSDSYLYTRLSRPCIQQLLQPTSSSLLQLLMLLPVFRRQGDALTARYTADHIRKLADTAAETNQTPQKWTLQTLTAWQQDLDDVNASHVRALT